MSDPVNLGFHGLKEPTGYGAVVLRATFNQQDVGAAWSRKTTYASGTEHAEDALVDFVEFMEFLGQYPLPSAGAENLAFAAQMLNSPLKQLELNLSASPCTSVERDGSPATSCKGDLAGCAERLIGLAGRGFSITVNAHHLYQPAIQGGKDASAKAVEAMRAAGITVNIG